MSNAVDELIDTLAFGKAKAIAGPCLGLYLSPEMVYIAETRHGKDGKISIDHLVRIPIPLAGKSATGTMTMSMDFLSDPAKIGALIRQSLSAIRWNSKNVVVTLSHHLGVLRYFPMPLIERRFLRTSVPIEAKKYIPISFDSLTSDFQAELMQPDSSGKPRLGVLIAVTQNKNLAHIAGLLASLELNLIGLEVAPCSVLRLWRAVEPARSSAPFVQVHFDEDVIRIMICDRGLPVFFREVFMGGAATLSDQRKVDMTGCLAFAHKQLGLNSISKIKLSGTPAALGHWKDAFTAETGVPAEIQDTAQMLSIKSGDWGGHAAIGASMRAAVASAVTINLAATDGVGEDERQVARDIIIAGMVFGVCIACVGIFQALTYNQRAKALKNYSLAPDVKAALGGLQAPEIDAMLVEMQEQSLRLNAVTKSQRLPISSYLRDIIELMPENMWLIKITATNPLADDAATFEIRLLGRVRGSTVGEEQSAVSKFSDTLRLNPNLKPLFDVNMTFTKHSAAPVQAGLSLDPEALARTFEGRTEFTITLKGKR